MAYWEAQQEAEYATEKSSLSLACSLVQDLLAYDLKSYCETLDLVLV